MDPSPSRWFGWSVVAVSAAILLEGAVSQLRHDSYTLTGEAGDCMGMGSRSGALAVCAVLGLCAFAYRWRGPSALWASVLLAECFRFVPCLVLGAYAVTTRPAGPGSLAEVAPGSFAELNHSVLFWWPTLSLSAALATVWALFRRPGPGVAPLAASALGAATALTACFHLFAPEYILPWVGMASRAFK